ncbi:Receptor protein kinase-like protein [Thalictrum thalictroides]|uniref:Receptor protein kinase-like protein n=1 Tax=Thalictrum thalictroides TaxID=46969 RepID=A0A7J6WL72_THATH|nr:Receptor protein kinase-like protein [Thalictrum thalictroides]
MDLNLLLLVERSSLQYMNFSYNRLTGEIPVEFAKRIPANATLDLSFNNLAGEVPDIFLSHKTEYFAGNPDLCGIPLKNPCSNTTVLPNLTNDSSSPSSTTTIPTTSTNSPPAIATIPKTIDSSFATDSPDSEKRDKWISTTTSK